jgi:hypothetical protein
VNKLISGLQIRAARALLRWSSANLAEISKVGITTVKRYELVDGIPAGNIHTLGAIHTALKAAGIEFIGSPDNDPGVRLHSKPTE